MEAQKPPPKYTSPKGMWISKFILRSIMLIFSVTLVALAGSLMNLGLFTSIPFLIVAPAGFLSLAWNLAEGICLLTRGGHRGIHPGANVGLDLIIWLGLTATCVVLSLVGVGASVLSSSSYSSLLYARNHDSTSYTGFGLDVSNAARAIVSKGQALLGIGAVLDILHFTTFVIACYETNVRNRMGRQQTIIMVQNTPAPMQSGFYGQQSGYPQPVYPQPTFNPIQPRPVAGQQMYYPPAAAQALNQPPQMQFQPQPLHPQPLYPPKGIEAHQGQPSTPSPPPPPVYLDNSPVSSATELCAQKRH